MPVWVDDDGVESVAVRPPPNIHALWYARLAAGIGGYSEAQNVRGIEFKRYRIGILDVPSPSPVQDQRLMPLRVFMPVPHDPNAPRLEIPPAEELVKAIVQAGW